MRKFNLTGFIVLFMVTAAAVPAFAADVTVGRFYTQIAKAKQLGAVDAPTAEASLRAAGFRLPDLALGKSLTEGDVTSISTALGLNVTTSRPAELVTESQMNQFVSNISAQLGAAKGSQVGTPYTTFSQEGDPGNSGNGKGKKKGHNKSSSEPI